jgi:hypothetical protein
MNENRKYHLKKMLNELRNLKFDKDITREYFSINKTERSILSILIQAELDKK